MFDLDIKVSSNEYFDLIRKLECLTSENEHLKGLNKNQMNMIIDLRNEITDLKKQNGDLCELVGKTKKESEDLKGTISRMHGGCQRAVELRRLLNELFDIKPNELVYDDEIRQRMKDLRAGAKDLQDENAARIEAYEKLDKQYKQLSHEYSKALSENAACSIENYRLRRKLDNGCNTCPDMENTKKKNDELRELIDFKRNQIEEQANTIRDLDKKLAELRAGAKDLQERNQILKDKLKSVCETCDVPDNCVNASEAVLKDADAKIQSANDKAANAKKEAKQAKETAERYREENFVLRRKINQLTRLNDELIKELARQQNAELIMKFDRKGED